jgi:hypothetical protein
MVAAALLHTKTMTQMHHISCDHRKEEISGTWIAFDYLSFVLCEIIIFKIAMHLVPIVLIAAASPIAVLLCDGHTA